MSSLHAYFKLYMKETNYLPCFRAANQALSATPLRIAAALYKIGDRVKAIPDTARSVHPMHSVTFYGIVAEVEKTETCWMYKLLSGDIARLHLWVPEARVRPMPISVSDNVFIKMRAFSLLERLAAEKQKTVGHNIVVIEQTVIRPMIQHTRVPFLSCIQWTSEA